jgi:uncharacterized metal-binding protein
MADNKHRKDLRCDLCDECLAREGVDCFDIGEAAKPRYDGGVLKMHQVAAGIEAEGYMKDVRLVELIKFCRRIGYKKIGLAFCIGMAGEARALAEILLKHFEVSAVCCKTGAIDKKDLGNPYLRDLPFEPACNPIGQAELLNREGTDLNLIVGLCVGHDIVFTQHSKAPVSTFIVKDRVLGHNPAAALYSGYYRRKIEQLSLD